MAWDVHIHVCMPCDKNEPAAKVAAEHLTPALKDECREAGWYLEELSKRTGSNPGNKGGLSLWGIVGNYTDVEKFVEVLRPFWLGLYAVESLLDFEHIMVFEEQEQRERTTAYEISYERDTKELTITKHLCPFSFMQM